MSVFLKFQKHFADQDELLLKEFQDNGNLDTLGKLFEKYIHLVYGVCLKYLKDREDSKDAVMAIFELLADKIQNFEIKNFKSWLYVTTKNHCLMELRKKGTFDRLLEKTEHESFVEFDPFVHHPNDTNSFLNGKLQDCIAQLKEKQRKCVELFYLQEKCYQEIAVQLNIGLKEVKSSIQNGKRNLKICLEKHNEEQEQ